MTLVSSNRIPNCISSDDQKYVDDFDNDEEDDWKPKKKKQRITKLNNKNKNKNKDVLVAVSSSTSKLNYLESMISLNKLWCVY